MPREFQTADSRQANGLEADKAPESLETVYRTALHDWADAVLIAECETGRILFVNNAAADWLGASVDALVGQRFDHLVEIGVDLQAVQNDARAMETPLSPRRQPDVGGAKPFPDWKSGKRMGTVRSVAGALVVVAHETSAPHRPGEPTLDPLTHLPNRTAIAVRLDEELSGNAPGAASVAVLFIDLDNFKEINDRWGHLVGDVALTAVAERMAHCIRGEDLLGRYGGDEFVAILPRVATVDAADLVADRIRQCLDTPIDVHGVSIQLATSIGVAISGEGYESAVELLHAADQRMYRDKQQRDKQSQ